MQSKSITLPCANKTKDSSSNLTQKEVTTWEEVGLFFDCMCKNNVQSLFGFQFSSSNNSHAPIVNCYSLVRLIDANYWPTTRGGKKVKWPFVFKITQHTNNWEASRLLLQCIVFPVVDQRHLGMDKFTILFLITNNTMSLLAISLDVHVSILLKC